MKRLLLFLTAIAVLMSFAACTATPAQTDPLETAASETGSTETQEVTAPPTEMVVPVFDAAAASGVIGTWKVNQILDGEILGLEGFESEVAFPLVLTFDADGGMSTGYLESEMEAATQAFTSALKTYHINLRYSQYPDKATANAETQRLHGMSVEEYVDKLVGAINFATLFSAFRTTGVYCVEGDTLYMGSRLSSQMEALTILATADTVEEARQKADRAYAKLNINVLPRS